MRRLLDRLRRRPPRPVAPAHHDEVVRSAEEEVLLGIPAGTVKTRMMRARAVLREELS